MVIGPISNTGYIPATERVGAPSMRSTAQIAPSTPPTTARISQNTLNMFFNSDGDRAEISTRARGLSYQFNSPSSTFDPSFMSLSGNFSGINAPSGDAEGAPSTNIAENGTVGAVEPRGNCTTCENRRYVDKSDDASVSFQTPTNISPNMSAAAVAAHENEHVRNEQARAHRDGREIVHQSVSLTYDTCPECGRHYVSGGTTRTTSVSKSDSGDMTNEEESPDEEVA